MINEDDQVIGLESRRVVHQKGLLHREIHIWFITPDCEIIFQHRSEDKDTYPDKLDATVGGHVDPGMSYEDTALKECKEETGIDIDSEGLKLVAKMHKKSFDNSTGLINNTIRFQYVYLFDGDINDLQVEKGKAIGFEKWKIENLTKLSEEDRGKFIPLILSDDMLDIFEKGQKILGIK